MMHKERKIMQFWDVTLWLVLFLTVIPKTYSDEFPNVGIKDMSITLKKRFPICDKQLVVNWINPEKLQGYTEYDTYNVGGRYIDRFKAFVNAGGGSLTYKLVIYHPKNQNDGMQGFRQQRHKGDKYYPYLPEQNRWVRDNFDELYDLVSRYGLFYRESGAYSDEQSKTVSQITSWIRNLNLTNRTENVCVIYPDETTAWLVESKAIRYTHTKEQIDVLYERLKLLIRNDELLKGDPERHRRVFESLSAYDLNNDGVEDYLSVNKAIFSLKKRDGSIGYQDKYFFGCSKSNIGVHENSQITTNGKEFFHQYCNISRLVK